MVFKRGIFKAGVFKLSTVISKAAQVRRLWRVKPPSLLDDEEFILLFQRYLELKHGEINV